MKNMTDSYKYIITDFYKLTVLGISVMTFDSIEARISQQTLRSVTD